ncbi:winged helix-turn-helix domain-containing protein [Actinomadura hibisca]|uniref:winged helix-turn-helix domain-containing protein n=1 Tax=Actinomadura hibisca TaxID=68565 RepID=UPI0035A21F1F
MAPRRRSRCWRPSWTAHGYGDDQRWTLGRVAMLIQRLFGVDYTLPGVSLLLCRHGWSVQVPGHRAVLRGHAAILALGCSPALGFIHSGTQLAFVYDIADLFKTHHRPLAFSLHASTSPERQARLALREEFRLLKLMLTTIQQTLDPSTPGITSDRATEITHLWDPQAGALLAGTNYADVPTPVRVSRCGPSTGPTGCGALHARGGEPVSDWPTRAEEAREQIPAPTAGLLRQWPHTDTKPTQPCSTASNSLTPHARHTRGTTTHEALLTLHSGHEQTIWEGETQNVTARATGGRFTLKYRLTTHYLYFETGGIGGTRQEQVPLINVQDVDISQTLVQKTRKVGNVLVHIIRQNGAQETAVFDSVPDPVMVRDLINQTVHHVRAAAHQRQIAEQQQLNVHRYEQTSPAFGMQPAAPGMPPAPAYPAPAPAVQPALAGTPVQPQPAYTADQTMALLKQLGELRDAGVLTLEEFEAKKQELLARL